MLEHDLNTWINHDITIRLVLIDVAYGDNEPNEVCLYSRLCHVGDTLEEDDMNEILSFMSFIRDCPNEVNRFVRNKDETDKYGLEWLMERKKEWTGQKKQAKEKKER